MGSTPPEGGCYWLHRLRCCSVSPDGRHGGSASLRGVAPLEHPCGWHRFVLALVMLYKLAKVTLYDFAKMFMLFPDERTTAAPIVVAPPPCMDGPVSQLSRPEWLVMSTVEALCKDLPGDDTAAVKRTLESFYKTKKSPNVAGEEFLDVILGTSRMFKHVIDKMDLRGKRVLVFCGSSGTGKTTLITLLCGGTLELVTYTDEFGEEYETWQVRGQHESAKIGHDPASSTTFLPEYMGTINLPDVGEVALIDFPGFEDIRCEALNFGINAGFRHLLQEAGTCHLVACTGKKIISDKSSIPGITAKILGTVPCRSYTEQKVFFSLNFSPSPSERMNFNHLRRHMQDLGIQFGGFKFEGSQKDILDSIAKWMQCIAAWMKVEGTAFRREDLKGNVCQQAANNVFSDKDMKAFRDVVLSRCDLENCTRYLGLHQFREALEALRNETSDAREGHASPAMASAAGWGADASRLQALPEEPLSADTRDDISDCSEKPAASEQEVTVHSEAVTSVMATMSAGGHCDLADLEREVQAACSRLQEFSTTTKTVAEQVITMQRRDQLEPPFLRLFLHHEGLDRKVCLVLQEYMADTWIIAADCEIERFMAPLNSEITELTRRVLAGTLLLLKGKGTEKENKENSFKHWVTMLKSELLMEKYTHVEKRLEDLSESIKLEQELVTAGDPWSWGATIRRSGAVGLSILGTAAIAGALLSNPVGWSIIGALGTVGIIGGAACATGVQVWRDGSTKKRIVESIAKVLDTLQDQAESMELLRKNLQYRHSATIKLRAALIQKKDAAATCLADKPRVMDPAEPLPAKP